MQDYLFFFSNRSVCRNDCIVIICWEDPVQVKFRNCDIFKPLQIGLAPAFFLRTFNESMFSNFWCIKITTDFSRPGLHSKVENSRFGFEYESYFCVLTILRTRVCISFTYCWSFAFAVSVFSGAILLISKGKRYACL